MDANKLDAARIAWSAAIGRGKTASEAWNSAYDAAFYTGRRGADAGIAAWTVAKEHNAVEQVNFTADYALIESLTNS